MGSLPFDSDRKRMSAIIKADGEYLSLVKGAPPTLFYSAAPRCG